MFYNHIGEFSALLVAIFWTITAIAFESASKKAGSLSVNLIRLILAFIFLSVFNFFYRGVVFPSDAGRNQWLWLSLSGLVGFVFGDLCLFKAFTVIGSRLSMLIMTLAPPIAAISGYFLMDENLSLYGICGITITLTGIFLAVAGHNKEQEKLTLKVPLRGYLYALGGAFGQAFGLILSKKGMNGYDAFASTQIRIITGIAGFTIIILLARRTTQVFSAIRNKSAMTGISIGSFFGPFLGVSLSLLSLKYTSTGIAATIMSTTPVLIILPSILIFKQKVSFIEICGAFLSVIGVGFFFLK
jgi:drug/metabolite transporter (DMT)-like permease